MELKDFIKGVVFDITNAVKECQEELDNGAIVSPINGASDENKIKTMNGYFKVSNIDFEVAVSVDTETGEEGIAKRGIEVGGSALGLQFGAKIGDKSINERIRESNENTSKIRFSIPVIYPTYTGKREKKS